MNHNEYIIILLLNETKFTKTKANLKVFRISKISNILRIYLYTTKPKSVHYKNMCPSS